MLLPYLKSCRELRADPKQKEQSISQEPNCGCWRSTDYCSPVRATRFQRQYSPDGGAHFGGRLLHCWLSGLTCTPSPHPARVGDTGALLWSSLPAHLPFPSCGHSSQGSPQPSPGILLQQHRALVVLKALGTEHFPLSKRVKQKLWRVSAGGRGNAQVIADRQDGDGPLPTLMSCTHRSTVGRCLTAQSLEGRHTGSCQGYWCTSQRGRCWAPLRTR